MKPVLALPLAAVAWFFVPATATAQQVAGVDLRTEGLQHEYVVSGFVGSTFGDNMDNSSVDFGGSLSYLYNGLIGGEFLANFAPDANLEATSAFVPNGSSWVNSYMVNAIVAAPVGEESLFQPFVSGGFGAINLRLDQTDFGDVDPFQNNLDDTRAGANIGAGLMAFRDRVGVRGDVRWYTGLGDSTGPLSTSNVLADASFWRANVGVSYRW